MSSRVPISPLSAAHILVSWVTEHGREPRLRECCASNGLLFWRTFLDKIPASTFSACIYTARAIVSNAPKPRMQSCLGSDCDATFLYQGYHFCPDCRATLGYDDEDIRATGKYLRAHNREAALRYDGLDTTKMWSRQATALPGCDGLCGEDDEVPGMWNTREMSCEDTVYSFDDLVALQMNAWARISKKRRFFQEG